MTRKLRLWAGTMVAIAAIGACSSGGDDEPAALKGPAPQTDSGAGMAYDSEMGQLSAGSMGSDRRAAVGMSLPAVGPAVIKTGDVTVKVAEGSLEDSLRDIIEVARSYGGFVLSTSVEDQGTRTGTAVIRVPAESFEDALADAHELGEVIREQVSGEDVTQEFVDLDARLRNFEAQESVLLDLMAKSVSVADTLRVQRELQDVQLEIERLRGRLRYLRDQTDLSTITLRIRETEPVVAATGLIERAWKRSVDTFNAIVSAVVIGGSVALPIGLLVVLVLMIARFVRPRLPSWGTREG